MHGTPKVGCPQEGRLPASIPTQCPSSGQEVCPPDLTVAPLLTSGFFGDVRAGPSTPTFFPSGRPARTLSAQVFPEFPRPWGHEEKAGAMAGEMLLPP